MFRRKKVALRIDKRKDCSSKWSHRSSLAQGFLSTPACLPSWRQCRRWIPWGICGAPSWSAASATPMPGCQLPLWGSVPELQKPVTAQRKGTFWQRQMSLWAGILWRLRVARDKAWNLRERLWNCLHGTLYKPDGLLLGARCSWLSAGQIWHYSFLRPTWTWKNDIWIIAGICTWTTDRPTSLTKAERSWLSKCFTVRPFKAAILSCSRVLKTTTTYTIEKALELISSSVIAISKPECVYQPNLAAAYFSILCQLVLHFPLKRVIFNKL